MLIAEMPKLMRDIIVDTVLPEPDIEIVGEVAGGDDLLQLAGRTRPDVVIRALDRADLLSEFDRLLYTYPETRVLAVTTNGRQAILYELRPQQVPLGEASPHGLLAAIRATRTHLR